MAIMQSLRWWVAALRALLITALRAPPPPQGGYLQSSGVMWGAPHRQLTAPGLQVPHNPASALRQW